MTTPTLPMLRRIVRRALAEDVGRGDVTSQAVVPTAAKCAAAVAMREAGVIAGLAVAEIVFREVDAGVDFRASAADGDAVDKGAVVAEVSGPARAVLTAERTALNFLQRMSGIATLTRRYVSAVAGTSARILDTRKTAPGLRRLDKWAVALGGGTNHRFGLYDGILIKDNHLRLAGGVRAAVGAAKQGAPHRLRVQVEVESLEQAREALDARAESLLLDNMSPRDMRAVVELARGRALTEASGGVTLKNVREIAETGVDFISVGALTHSAPALDIALDISA
ncbi:MAG: carboxylating nicotinate-nucleotide diphosphorylase [Armatimonadota bacterium]|nr:MAG: carboxylating nicotinate-nucleotide diphosphorylase [Armatimonadota bacterium]